MVRPLPYRILQLLLLLAVARHVGLALFVHPFADDFSYAVAGMRSPLLERLLHEYGSWNGRYFSNILLLRGPLTLGLHDGLQLYRLAAIGLMLLTGLAAYHALRSLFRRSLDRGIIATIALLFLLLYLHLMPDASEGFYWYTGAMTYQLPNALSLFLLANWIRVIRHEVKPGWSWALSQGVLIVIIAGCNELHMAYLVLFHAVLLVMRGRARHKVDPWVLVMLVVSVVAAIIVAVAPGNGTRGALFPQRHEPALTMFFSLAQTARFTLQWIFSIPFLLCSYILLVGRRWAIGAGVVRPLARPWNKWVALALPFGLVMGAMVVTYWPTGMLGQHRTVNVALFYFLPAWAWALIVWDQQVFQRCSWWPAHGPARHILRWTWVVLVAALFLLGRDRHVTADLLSGRVERYDRLMHDRYGLVDLAIREGRDRVELPFIEAPAGLRVVPLDTSPDHWINRSMADHFGDARLDIIGRPPPARAE